MESYYRNENVDHESYKTACHEYPDQAYVNEHPKTMASICNLHYKACTVPEKYTGRPRVCGCTHARMVKQQRAAEAARVAAQRYPYIPSNCSQATSKYADSYYSNDTSKYIPSNTSHFTQNESHASRYEGYGHGYGAQGYHHEEYTPDYPSRRFAPQNHYPEYHEEDRTQYYSTANSAATSAATSAVPSAVSSVVPCENPSGIISESASQYNNQESSYYGQKQHEYENYSQSYSATSGPEMAQSYEGQLSYNSSNYPVGNEESTVVCSASRLSHDHACSAKVVKCSPSCETHDARSTTSKVYDGPSSQYQPEH